MKKRRIILSIVLVLAIVIGVVVLINVLPKKENFSEKEVTAHIYSLEDTETIRCLFKDELPDLAYISAEDFLNNAYEDPVSETENGDGTYTITNTGGSIVIDTKNDTIYSDCFEDFSNVKANFDGTELDVPYQETLATEIEGEKRA